MTGNRADALARLDVFVGEWVMEARFPGDQPTPSSAAGDGPQVRSRFEWALDRQFLLQRTEIPERWMVETRRWATNQFKGKKMSKAARKGKIFIDYLRNDKSATAVAAYSLRTKKDAPVAMPVS